MTVTNSSNKTIINGNGATTVFTFSFEILLASELFVIYTDATGMETEVSSSLYTTTGVGTNTGGTVTYPLSGSPIATGTTLTIIRLVPYKQPTGISNQGAFYPTVVETAIDNVVFQTQQLAEQINRSLTLNITSTATIPIVSDPVANAVLQYDSTATFIEAGPDASDIANAQGYANAASASATLASGSATASAASATAAAASAASIAAGPVQSVSGGASNGFTISVANPATTPIITPVLGNLGSSVALQINGRSPTRYSTTTTETVVLADMGGWIDQKNSSACTCTIPPHSTMGAAAEDEVVIYQSGTGQVTPTAGSGVTLLTYNSTTKTAGQGAAVFCKQTSVQNTWRVTGNMA